VRGFYLAGGSGLALRLGHRRSLDHDFFRLEPFRPTELQDGLARVCGPVTPLRIEKGTLSVEVWNAKASFFHYPYPLIEPAEALDGLFPTAGLRDIGLMKLTAIADRGLKKDFIDLYAILHSGIGLEELLELLPQKFPGVRYQRYHFLKALTWFQDAGDEPLQLLDFRASWEEVQEFFRAEVTRLQV
jgi:hypothetical protein